MKSNSSAPRSTFVAAFALAVAASSSAWADDTITLGAAISMTGKTAKEGDYTRDGYQFAIDTINQDELDFVRGMTAAVVSPDRGTPLPDED